MKTAADKAGVQIVAGDTKVVERGKCDKIFINTSGIGIVPNGVNISPRRVAQGDVIICSGPIGVHGITILSTREGLAFETALKSDTASLNQMMSDLVSNITEIHVMRDPTRGGVGTTLNEIADAAQVEIELDEKELPVPDAVKAASEMLGLDPIYIANEGVALVVLPAAFAEKALAIMKRYPEGQQAVVIGKVVSSEKASVRMKTLYGGSRIIGMLNGDQLPRIC